MASPILLRLRRELREFSRTCVDLVCPPTCPGCGVSAVADGLCQPCRSQLSVRHRPWCPRCGAPVSGSGARCPADHRHIRGLLLCRAPLRYRGTGGDLVRRFKFDGDRGALRILSMAMAGSLADWVRTAGRRAIFVSVPVHPSKRRERGFDHAAWLAEAVARRLRRPFLLGALRRVRPTLPQGDVRVMSRRENVRDAFAVHRPRRLDGQLVVLVDDVRTSGHTALECARVLRSAGVRGVALSTAAQS